MARVVYQRWQSSPPTPVQASVVLGSSSGSWTRASSLLIFFCRCRRSRWKKRRERHGRLFPALVILSHLLSFPRHLSFSHISFGLHLSPLIFLLPLPVLPLSSPPSLCVLPLTPPTVSPSSLLLTPMQEPVNVDPTRGRRITSFEWKDDKQK